MNKELVKEIESYIEKTNNIPSNLKGYSDEVVMETVDQLINKGFIIKATIKRTPILADANVIPRATEHKGYGIDKMRLIKEIY